jgi:hypothetical protein
MRRERRQPTKAEWRAITTHGLFVRRIREKGSGRKGEVGRSTGSSRLRGGEGPGQAHREA